MGSGDLLLYAALAVLALYDLAHTESTRDCVNETRQHHPSACPCLPAATQREQDEHEHVISRENHEQAHTERSASGSTPPGVGEGASRRAHRCRFVCSRASFLHGSNFSGQKVSASDD